MTGSAGATTGGRGSGVHWRRLCENRFAGAWELHAENWTDAHQDVVFDHPAALFHVLNEDEGGVTLVIILDAVTEAEAFTAARWLMEDVVDDGNGGEVTLDWRWERAIGEIVSQPNPYANDTENDDPPQWGEIGWTA